uniref:Ig-like domain-containing protein n=1 Tax=Poecilia mexicana TaxID=48701 RepID=A0A3B3WKF7_9TELE
CYNFYIFVLLFKENIIFIIIGNSKRTLTYTTLDSETLQCSVVLEYWDSSCSGDLSVFWLKSGSSKSYPNIIYTEGKRDDNCEKSPNNKCRYNFSKNISSSDVGTYYCAVATCKEILLGNGTRIESARSSSYEVMLLLVITGICLIISVILNIILICCRTQRTPCKNFRVQYKTNVLFRINCGHVQNQSLENFVSVQIHS